MAITIQKGDTLSSIAQANNTSVSELARINNIADVNKIQAGQSLNLGSSEAGFIGPKPMPVTKLEQPTPDLSKVQGAIAEASVIPTAGLGASNRIMNAPDAVVPEPVEAQPLTTKEKIEQGLLGELGRDLTAEKAQLREDADTESKAIEANRLRNQIRTERLDYEDRKQELKKNAEGRLTGAVNNEINKLTEDFNRNAVRTAIRFDIANADYLSAQQTVDNAIADLNAESTRKNQLFSTLFDFVQNDMSESEKLQAQQAFQEKQDETAFARQKEIANYNSMLRRSELAFDQGIQTVADQRAAEEESKKLVPELDDKINKLQAVIDHKGKDSRVGTNFLARTGLFGIQGLGDKFSGRGADFAGSVQQLYAQETLDTLISLKAKGGTLGALSDQERIMLQNAATKLANWEIKKDGVGTGFWNISEKMFDAEVRNLQDLSIRARNAVTYGLVSDEEANEI